MQKQPAPQFLQELPVGEAAVEELADGLPDLFCPRGLVADFKDTLSCLGEVQLGALWCRVRRKSGKALSVQPRSSKRAVNDEEVEDERVDASNTVKSS